MLNKNLFIIVFFIYEVCALCTTNGSLSCNFNIKGYATVTCSDKCLSVGTYLPAKNSLYYCNSSSTSTSTKGSNSSTKGPNSNVGLIAGVVTGGSALLLLSFCFIYWKIKTKGAKNIPNDETKNKKDTELKPVVTSYSTSETTSTLSKTDTAANVNLHSIFKKISDAKLVVSSNNQPNQIKAIQDSNSVVPTEPSNSHSINELPNSTAVVHTPNITISPTQDIVSHSNVSDVNRNSDTRRSSLSDRYGVMISFHVESSKVLANQLKAYLEQRNISVFVCTDLKLGSNFRTKIAAAALHCRVFVPLINEEWAKSKECDYEYNIAQRSAIKDGHPLIAPIIVTKFDVKLYDIVQALLCNFNVIFMNDDPPENAFAAIAEAVNNLIEIEK